MLVERMFVFHILWLHLAEVSVGDVIASGDSVGWVAACLQHDDGKIFALVDSLQLVEVLPMHSGLDDSTRRHRLLW